MYAITVSHLVIFRIAMSRTFSVYRCVRLDENQMNVYFVNFLLSLACVVVLPAPAPQQPQQMGNIGIPYFGPFTAMFDLASLFPNSVLTTAENMVHAIPLVNIVPAVIESGIKMGESIAKDMDSRISDLEIGRGVPNLPQQFPAGQYYGQSGIPPGAWPSNFPNSQTNPIAPALPPFPTQPPFLAQPPFSAQPPFPALPSVVPAVPAPPAMPAYDNLYQVNADSILQSTKPSGEHRKEEQHVEKSTNGHKTVKITKKTAPKKKH